jgi:hypothetical protein
MQRLQSRDISWGIARVLWCLLLNYRGFIALNKQIKLCGVSYLIKELLPLIVTKPRLFETCARKDILIKNFLVSEMFRQCRCMQI